MSETEHPGPEEALELDPETVEDLDAGDDVKGGAIANGWTDFCPSQVRKC